MHRLIHSGQGLIRAPHGPRSYPDVGVPNPSWAPRGPGSYPDVGWSSSQAGLRGPSSAPSRLSPWSGHSGGTPTHAGEVAGYGPIKVAVCVLPRTRNLLETFIYNIIYMKPCVNNRARTPRSFDVMKSTRPPFTPAPQDKFTDPKTINIIITTTTTLVYSSKLHSDTCIFLEMPIFQVHSIKHETFMTFEHTKQYVGCFISPSLCWL